MDYRSISEYIENLPLKETLCRGYKPNDVYEVICNISSMYNELLSEACKELEAMRKNNHHAPCMAYEIDKKEQKNTSIEETHTAPEVQPEKEVRPMEKVKKTVLVESENPAELVAQIDNLPMTDKEIRKLKRRDLLEILLEQSKEKESLQKQLDEKNHMISALNQQLETREIHLKEAGTIADAAFKLNGVYSAVVRAAEQYLDNLQTLYEKEKDVYAKKEKEVYQKCRALIDATYQKCDAVKADTVKTCKALILSTEKRCKEKEEEAEEKSRLILQQARMNSDAGDFDLSARLEDFCSTEEGFEEIMTFLK